jgi:hypothetical protein
MITLTKLKIARFKILFGTSLLIILVIIISNYFFFKSIPYNNFKINNSILKNGDLVLRCGRSTESYAVYLADNNNTEFTHIGIISIENHIPYVIHAVPWKINTVKKEPLNNFINHKVASTYAIYRTNYNSTILKNVVNQANLFYQKKYTFDNEYDLTTNTKLYCTELILKAFRNAGINLNLKTKSINYVVGKHNLIFPSEFTKSPFKKII